MNPRTIAIWIAANVAATFALGVAHCFESFFPPVLPGAIFGLAQTGSLMLTSRRFLAWFPVTALVTPPAMFVSGLLLAQTMNFSFDTPSAPKGAVEAFVDAALSGVPGWLIVAATQAIVFRFAGFRGARPWLLAVAIGGAALAPLGVASAVAAPRHYCDPMTAGGGPIGWAVAGLWYSGATALALRSMRRRTPGPQAPSPQRAPDDDVRSAVN